MFIMWVNKKVKAIFKFSSNWDREELAHCTVLTKTFNGFNISN
jgi:hypothetical protein